MKFLWPDRFRHTFAILPVILYAEDKIVFDSAQSAAMKEVNSMNKSENLHCSLGERRLAQHKNETKNTLTQDGFTLCTLKNTSTLRS
jgi:hypothetical protein